MTSEWRSMTLREAGVELFDCDHRTPPAVQDGIPYVAIPQLQDGRIKLSEARRISHANFLEWTRKTRPTAGDVVLSRRCNPGETAVVLPGAEFALGQNLVLLRADGKLSDTGFLRWAVRGPAWWEQINKFINVGAVFESLRCKDIPEFVLPFPPIKVQREIARVFDSLDSKIELLHFQNETLEALARAIFKSWFVDFDPVRAKAEGREPEGMDAATAALFPSAIEESERGEVPQGWNIKRLTDFMEVNPSRMLPKGKEAPYLEMANAPTVGPRPAKWADRLPISGCRFRNGDTLLAKITPCLENGKTAFVDFLGEDEVGWGSTEFIVLSPKCPIPPTFVYLLARNSNFRAFAIQSMSGTSGRQRVQVDQLAKFEFPIADGAVYGAFAEIVEPLFVAISHNDDQAKTLAQLRDTLLPRLISGKLRVLEAEKMMEVVL